MGPGFDDHSLVDAPSLLIFVIYFAIIMSLYSNNFPKIKIIILENRRR